MNKRRPLKIIAGAPDRPLVIGNIEIPCYVLEDETRVLSQGGFLQSIGRSRTPKAGTGGGVDNIPSFLAAKNLKHFIYNDLEMSTSPIPFQSKEGQKVFGYPATILPQVCEVYLKARETGVLLPSQRHIAQRAEILMRGLATVGIIALVDEVTGYQAIRDRQALENILDKYLRPYQARWAKRFPDEFYQEIFRLKGWGWQGMKVNRPQVVGNYTNNIVYERLTDGLLEQLRRRNPKHATGERQHKHHQFLTYDFGLPELHEHLVGAVAIMQTVTHHTPARAWAEFMRRLQRWKPRLNTTLDLPFDDDD